MMLTTESEGVGERLLAGPGHQVNGSNGVAALDGLPGSDDHRNALGFLLGDVHRIGR
jgi:hypothetical protein